MLNSPYLISISVCLNVLVLYLYSLLMVLLLFAFALLHFVLLFTTLRVRLLASKYAILFSSKCYYFAYSSSRLL
jgi:hypothetical protein